MGKNQRKHKKFIRQLIYLTISLAVFAAVLLYGRNLEQHSTYFFVKFQNSGKTTDEFKLSIADTEDERAKGLMFVKYMPQNEGMIFVYSEENVQAFWMKETYIPLDMVFVDKNWNVAGVLNNLPILNTEPRRVTKPSMYVIELNAGMAKKYGISEGSKVIFDGTPPKPKG
jgi:uncharacterized membrane protein (UPF0127 family)